MVGVVVVGVGVGVGGFCKKLSSLFVCSEYCYCSQPIVAYCVIKSGL